VGIFPPPVVTPVRPGPPAQAGAGGGGLQVEWPSLWYGLLCKDIGLFDRDTGLLCGDIWLFCREMRLFCAQLLAACRHKSAWRSSHQSPFVLSLVRTVASQEIETTVFDPASQFLSNISRRA